jgi:hypothetical protein
MGSSLLWVRLLGVFQHPVEPLVPKTVPKSPVTPSTGLNKERSCASERLKPSVALEKAGVEFIPENGGGAGVRLKGNAKR